MLSRYSKINISEGNPHDRAFGVNKRSTYPQPRQPDDVRHVPPSVATRFPNTQHIRLSGDIALGRVNDIPSRLGLDNACYKEESC